MSDIEKMLTDLNFYAQALEDSKRTIICHPSLVEAVQGVVDLHDRGGIYTVRASPICPDGRLLVLDEQALEASYRQAVQQGMRSLYR